jgi:two-component system, chemotaxis family, sensor kinase CheA
VTEDDEILQVFLEESREGLDQLELDLVELESRPRDPDLLGQIYRAVHSIKGTCGFLGYRRLESLTHRGEDVLDALRSGRLDFDATIATSLLRLTDAIRGFLDTIERTGDEGEDTDGELQAALTKHLETAAADPDGPRAAVLSPLPAGVSQMTDIRSAVHESSIRVDVEVLDSLMDLVGELVLVRGKIGELAAEEDGGSLVAAYRQLRRVSGELLESVMRARLQPVGIVTRKFPRIARDLAASMDKQIKVELDGEEVGVDRAVNEALADALVHLIRNIVDHGIESPGERLAAGKDPDGHLRIAASHEGGRVHLEVSDDGRGIDPERIAERAISSGLVTRDAVDGLDAAGRLELIFLPGLSTKAGVTSVSGRGVGMDAVRANLERVGGGIEVRSEVGRGTIFRIDVPLTLAIVPCVVVHCGGGRYCIPQASVQEVVRIGPDDLHKSVSEVGGAQLYRLRGGLVPLIELAAQFGSAPRPTPDGLTTVIVDADGKRFGILVEDVGDPVEAVVKPLTRSIRQIRLFSGVTIMSDGRAALIVDPVGLADAAGLKTAGPAAAVAEEASPSSQTASMLLATGTGGRHLAILMDSVWRLERVRRDRLQRGGGIDVLDYGDALLPLIRLDEALAANGARTSDEQHVDVIVCDSSTGRVGLVVESIEDVVAAEPVASPVPGRSGLARLEVDGRVAELLDVDALVAVAELTR